MSECRTGVRVCHYCRSIDSRGERVCAVNVPARVVGGGDTSNPRARNDLLKNKEACARDFTGHV